jgi:hypothetical protein
MDQNFCRACGLGLEKIALSLSEQLPARADQSLQARKERLEKLGVAMLSVFGAGVLGFLLYTIGKKFISTGDVFGLLAMLGFLVMIVCGIGSVVLFAKAKELGAETSKRRPQEVEAEPTKELLSEGHFEPVPTVTERTTELLTVERPKQ